MTFALAAIMLNTNAATRLLANWSIPNLLCIQQWQYFIFFYIGSMAHLHQNRFFSILDNGKIMGCAIVLIFFSYFLLYSHPMSVIGIKMTFLLWGGLGTALSFAFFRKYQTTLTSETHIGHALQYIGRRTLDVYLLHFFFLRGNLRFLGEFFRDNSTPAVELFASLLISTIVISLCLLTSNIIRLSPLLTHWLLGVKTHE